MNRAIVDDGAQLGEGSKVWHFAHVSLGARIGAGCSLGQGVYVGNERGDRRWLQGAEPRLGL